MITIAGIDQLRGNPDAIAHLAHAAFEDVFHIQPFADFPQVRVLALESERRGATGDAQCIDTREIVEQFLGQPIGKVFVGRVIAHVDERQHRDRFVRSLHAGTLLHFRAGLSGGLPVTIYNVACTEHHQGDDQQDDGYQVQLACARMSCRGAAVDIFFQLDAIGRELEHPGKYQR